MHEWIIPDWPAPPQVRACITTRAGGASDAPYASMNLGAHVGDDPARVAANRAHLSQTLGLTQPPQWLEQVHGINVVRAQADGLVRTADACFTQTPDIACTVMTADCLPVLLCDRAGTQVAALHCGWRSLAGGICAKALAQLTAAPEQLMAYLGPAISQENFEVGIDVLDAFFSAARSTQHTDAIANAFKPGKRPLHFYADIYALARAELAALGVRDVYGGGACTVRDPQFFSYRRDGTTGRMASVIWLAPV